jgi:biopolymer transport protein ExbD
MAIDVQRAVEDDELQLTTDLNVVPLTDVMLVLLIIFLVTIPVIVKTIPVQLPTYRNIVTQTKPENIVVTVDSKEIVYLNDNPTPVSQAQLRETLVNALRSAGAAHRSLPEVHIRGDKNVRFEAVGRVILACQQAGIQKVGFITEPHPLDSSSY